MRKFYPSWTRSAILGAQVGLGVVAGTLGVLLILTMFGLTQSPVTTTGLLRVAAIMPLLLLFFAAAFVLVGLLCPVKATPDGVFGNSPLGSKLFVPWKDIVDVKDYSVHGLRMLRLNRSSNSYSVVFYPDDLSEFVRFVQQHAGSLNPLGQWLLDREQGT